MSAVKYWVWRSWLKQVPHDVLSTSIDRQVEVVEAAAYDALELKYRKRLWSSHGHSGLYGDDGEIQCGTCLIDFKRDDLEGIEEKLWQAALTQPAAQEVDKPTWDDEDEELAQSI